jgi:glycogen operon protein
MTDDDWSVGYAKSLGVFLNGDAITEPGRRGQHITDDSFYLLLNAHYDDLDFILPEGRWGDLWSGALRTGSAGTLQDRVWAAGNPFPVQGREFVVLRRI